MFEISVETTFNATHAITVDGVEEEPHSHNWHVIATVQGKSLDDDGLLVDFDVLQHQLENAVSPLCDANLNKCPVLRNQNPTAERVAWYIAKQMLEATPTVLSKVTVTEAPQCKATYAP